MSSIDFLPDHVRLHRRQARRRWGQAASAAVCLSALAMLAWLQHGQVQRAQAALDSRQNQLLAVRDELRVVSSLLSQQADCQIKGRISQELGSRMDLSAVLAELSRRLPAMSSLTSLECSSVEVPLPPGASVHTGGTVVAQGDTSARARKSTDTRVKLTVTGVAPTDVDVANFIGQVSLCPLFEDVNMGFARNIEIDSKRRQAREFQVTCLLAR